MSFLDVLDLSDKKYGWYEPKKLKTFPDEEALFKMNQAQDLATKGQCAFRPMPKPPRGYYGNEDCQKEWWDRERKDYF